MNLFDQLSQWLKTRDQRKAMEMQAKGLCPECTYGTGLYPLINEFCSYECTSCNGSGLLNTWDKA
ncbi:methionine aminopeptidase [Ammoniphilus sp. 3BR4]|uniref:methionine aminopeptidase n=1 Tax=Ammoniphilus sp. 3BR4 TaxID=3158265 RepID=UPI003466F1B9